MLGQAPDFTKLTRQELVTQCLLQERIIAALVRAAGSTRGKYTRSPEHSEKNRQRMKDRWAKMTPAERQNYLNMLKEAREERKRMAAHKKELEEAKIDRELAESGINIS